MMQRMTISEAFEKFGPRVIPVQVNYHDDWKDEESVHYVGTIELRDSDHFIVKNGFQFGSCGNSFKEEDRRNLGASLSTKEIPVGVADPEFYQRSGTYAVMSYILYVDTEAVKPLEENLRDALSLDEQVKFDARREALAKECAEVAKIHAEMNGLAEPVEVPAKALDYAAWAAVTGTTDDQSEVLLVTIKSLAMREMINEALPGSFGDDE